jgi:hypothetical protein
LTMDRLLGHLAQFASLWSQGELLCTHALAYLLRNDEAEQAFSQLISSASGCPPLSKLQWLAEARQMDRGRPDLEGRTAAGAALVKIEAKLGAPFGDGQLDSYVQYLRSGDAPTVLLILAPERRRQEVISHTCAHFRVEGLGPWLLDPAPCVHVTVIAWEQVFEALAVASSGGFADDLAQFRAMYRVLIGDDIEPVTTDEEVKAWRESEGKWRNLVDRTTRQLTGGRLLPFQTEPGVEAYHLRYVCRGLGNPEPCYSVGTRHPFRDYTTPIWLRFHKDTGHFTRIRANLDRSPSEWQLVDSGGHLWFPLEVPRNSDGDTMIGALVERVQEIVAVAYRELPT